MTHVLSLYRFNNILTIIFLANLLIKLIKTADRVIYLLQNDHNTVLPNSSSNHGNRIVVRKMKKISTSNSKETPKMHNTCSRKKGRRERREETDIMGGRASPRFIGRAHV